MSTQTPFSPKQTDFLCFRSPDGFAAVDLNLVEGMLSAQDDEHPGRFLTTIHLTNGSHYLSVETVPELVERYAAVKQLRYAKERGETELIKENALTVGPLTISPAPAASAPDSAQRGIWRKAELK